MQASSELNRALLRLMGLGPNDQLDSLWNALLTVGEGLLVVLATYLLGRLGRTLTRRAARGTRMDAQLVILTGRLTYLAILVAGFFGVIFVVGGQSLITPSLGLVGLLGLAFGLAFQDVLKNFLSGVFLLVERPFKIGDEIKVGQHGGTVQTIRLRVTVLRGTDGETILVPNGEVFNSAVVVVPAGVAPAPAPKGRVRRGRP